MSGACDAEVFASVKLDVNASGASHVKYKGNATVTRNVSGAGSVKKVSMTFSRRHNYRQTFIREINQPVAKKIAGKSR